MLCAVNEDIEVWDRIAGRVLMLDPEGRVLRSQGFDPARPAWPQRLTPSDGAEPDGHEVLASRPVPVTPPTPTPTRLTPLTSSTSPTHDPRESGGAHA